MSWPADWPTVRMKGRWLKIVPGKHLGFVQFPVEPVFNERRKASEFRVAEFGKCPTFTHNLSFRATSSVNRSTTGSFRPVSMCNSGSGSSSPTPMNFNAMRDPSPIPFGLSLGRLFTSMLSGSVLRGMSETVCVNKRARSTGTALT